MNRKRSLMVWIKIFLFFIAILLLFIFKATYIISFDFIIEQQADFQYNAISLSSILAGFQFTGISILLSVTDKPRIERLWNYGYLDTLCRVSIIGILFNVSTILVAFILITIRVTDSILLKMILIEIFSIVESIAFFIWSIKGLAFLIRKAKKDSPA